MSSREQEILEGDPEAPAPEGVIDGRKVVAFVDGAFGGRRVILDGEPEEMIRRAAAADPKLARELKRRGWIP